MNEYVKIQTVYITKQQRSVEELAKLYSDNNLQSLVYKLLKEKLLDNGTKNRIKSFELILGDN